MTLSKSQYIRGLQCHKSLWLYKNKPELRDTPDSAQESLFNTGYQVGDLAKELFPNGIEIEFDANNFNGMIQKTKKLIKNGTKVIYEATFKENGIFAMADILVKNTDTNSWDMYEVKGSTGVKEYHLNDASIQWYALSNYIKLNRAYIVHIDNGYVRNHKTAEILYSIATSLKQDNQYINKRKDSIKYLKQGLDIHSLFNIEDVTDEVLNKQDDIPSYLSQMEEILQKQMPDIDIGTHCSDPHGCDFWGHCWKHIPEPSVFNLYRMWGSKKFELYHKGIVSYDDVINNNIPLNDTQKLQIEAYKDATVSIDKSIIKEFLGKIKYPINFFDFETFQNAIPRFDNQRPYAQMPFQYSLHVLHEDGTLEHKEFLGDENSDPRTTLIQQMLNDITQTGSIIAYNQSFEIGRIKDLATFAPKYEKKLLALNERFIDLIVPFRQKGYYHPDFNGSFSIKAVLPAMFPNNDELNYKKLGSVQNGGDAMDTFANLHLLKDKSKRDEIRKDLLAYCHLDTLAMVRIWEKLHEIIIRRMQMNNFWARFEEIDGSIYRWDTRIYIKPVDNIQGDDICLGAIIGKNPGSAKGKVNIGLQEINLDGDKLLPTVLNIFIKSYKLANMKLPDRAYIQVLNLFYLCEPDLNLAINEAKEKTIKGICKTEKKSFPFIWFAYGGDDKFLNIYKNRFKTIKASRFFYYDNQKGMIIQEIPTEQSSARHTQGLTHNFVLPYISNVLKEVKI